MATIVSCPACTRALQVPDEYLGQTVQCPECKHTFEAKEPAGSGVTSSGGTPKPPAPAWEEPPSPPKKRRYEDDDDRDDLDEEGGRRPVRKRRTDNRPGKVQAISIMTLIGGIYGIVFFLLVTLSSGLICCLWPLTYYSLVMGIMATVKGSQLLGQEGHRMAPPKTIAIMMIINVINGDVINCVLGILNLVFLSDPEVEEFFRG